MNVLRKEEEALMLGHTKAKVLPSLNSKLATAAPIQTN